MTTRLIYGPPGAGKTTYAREHAQDGDLVIDLDDIRANVGNEQTARKMRDLMESGAREHDGDVWIIRTLAKADERAEFMARVGVDEAVPLAVDADTAKERARKRGDSDEKISAIDRWWENYTPDEGGESEDPAMGQTNTAPSGEPQAATPTAVEATEQESPKEALEADLRASGVPADVPVAEMSVEQQAAYWKARSRANEREAQEAREALKNTAAERKPAADTPAPVPTFDPAVREVFEARLEAALAKRPEFADVPLAKHLDLSTFVDADGRVDREAVAAFVEALPQGAAVNTAGTPAGWGSNAAYQGASGIDAGRELFKASRANL